MTANSKIDPNAMNRRDQIVSQIILLVITASVLFPILYVIGLSFNPDPRRPTSLVIWPAQPTLDNYKQVLDHPTANPVSFAQLALNSFGLSSGVAAVSILFAVFAAYAFSRFQFKGRSEVMIFIFVLRLIPGVATLLPMFLLLNRVTTSSTVLGFIIGVAAAIILFAVVSWFVGRLRDNEVGTGAIGTLLLGLIIGGAIAYGAYDSINKGEEFILRNSLYGVGIAMVSGGLPFAVWNLKGYLDTIPKELEEAARIDGASFNQTFFRVVLPLAAPVLAVTFFLNFMGNWAEFYVSWQFLTDPSNYTLSMTLWNIVGQYAANIPWNIFAAYAVVMALPVAIIYLVFQRQIVGGLTLGGVKG